MCQSHIPIARKSGRTAQPHDIALDEAIVSVAYTFCHVPPHIDIYQRHPIARTGLTDFDGAELEVAFMPACQSPSAASPSKFFKVPNFKDDSQDADNR